MNLQTRYLGLALKNPLVPSSSPLTGDWDSVRRLEDAGAAAIVLPSLFEEDLRMEGDAMHRYLDQLHVGHYEAQTYLHHPHRYESELDLYLAHLQRCKQQLSIPVIASLNGVHDESWLEYARLLEEAGAASLELNLYSVAANASESSLTIESRYLSIVKRIATQVRIPVTVKLASQFTSPAYMIKSLETAGAKGAVIFNRFYQPDIDLETLNVVPEIHLSNEYESLLRIRWLALLRGQVNLSLAATGGFHSHESILKGLMAGADAIYLCSVLLQKGPQHLSALLNDLLAWMETHEYESVEQMQGSVAAHHAIDRSAYERENYLAVMAKAKRYRVKP